MQTSNVLKESRLSAMNQGGIAVSIVIVLFISLITVLLVRRMLKSKTGIDSETFITARNTQQKFKIAWTLFVCNAGVWNFGSVAHIWNNKSKHRLIDVATFAIASGSTISFVAFVGAIAEQRFRRPLSFSDVIFWRYGRSAQVLVTTLAVAQMASSLVTECYILGLAFQELCGINGPIIPTFVLAVSTACATYSGLFVSIAVDSLRALLCFIIATCSSVLLLMHLLDNNLATKKLDIEYRPTGLFSTPGYTLGILARALLNEANWQRLWAASSPRELTIGGIMAGTTTIFYLMALGVPMIILDSEIPLNTISNRFGMLTASTATKTLFIALLTTSAEGSMEALVNGIGCLLASGPLQHYKILFSKVLVAFLVCVPAAIVAGTTKVNAQVLLTFWCTASCCIMGPLLLGLVDRGRAATCGGASGSVVMACGLISALTLSLVSVLTRETLNINESCYRAWLGHNMTETSVFSLSFATGVLAYSILTLAWSCYHAYCAPLIALLKAQREFRSRPRPLLSPRLCQNT